MIFAGLHHGNCLSGRVGGAFPDWIGCPRPDVIQPTGGKFSRQAGKFCRRHDFGGWAGAFGD